MKLSLLLVIVGFCLGALGAAGFHTPIADGETDLEAGTPETEEARSTETLAWPFFAAGLGLLLVGGFLTKKESATDGVHESEHATAKGEFATMLAGLSTAVAELDDAKADLDAEETKRRVDELLSGPWFDLTQRHEELMKLVGFSGYAKVWDGVAMAERLLGRVWSMITDGHPDEAIEELPHAREAIERAATAMAAL